MKVLLLPGVNPKTETWIRELTHHFGISTNQSCLHRYLFWENPDQSKSLRQEIENLPKDHYDLVLAKSVGSLVLMQATFELHLTWDKAIVFGIPLKIIEETNFNIDALSIVRDKQFYIVQQIDDPLGPVIHIKEYEPFNICSIEGSDHQYDIFELFSQDVFSWLEK